MENSRKNKGQIESIMGSGLLHFSYESHKSLTVVMT